jgi:hypothetical protein
MLVNLVRCSTIAKLCGVTQSCARNWARRAGIEFVRSPVLDQNRTGARQGPCYLPIAEAMRLIDVVLPRQLDRVANERARHYASAQARRLEDSTRAVRHEPGGYRGGHPGHETAAIAAFPGFQEGEL